MLRKALTAFLVATIALSEAQSNWSFVGPYSNNNLNGSEFETSQLNKIAGDPNNPNHMFVGGIQGGLWETIDKGDNWNNINSSITGLNGINAICFISSSEILVGNANGQFNKGQGQVNISTIVGKYNFQNNTWQSLGLLPTSLPYLITSIVSYPGYIFVGTSVGLFRSTNSGLSWTHVLQNKFVENMVFIPKNGPGYYLYVAGSDAYANTSWPSGRTMLMESSNDGNTFVDLSANLTMPSTWLRGVSMLCLGNQNNPNGDRDVFLMTTACIGTPYGWDPLGWDTYSGKFFVDKITKNINSNTISYYSYTPANIGYSGMGSTRNALGYDPYNNHLWIGGRYLNYLNLNNNVYNYSVKASVHSTNGNIHDDIHDIYMLNGSGSYEMFVAHDGGVVKACLGPNCSSFPHFDRLNNGLNVCLINGFSGSQELPNIYAIGGQDIVNTDIYDANIQRNIYTKATWENDGTLIDKYDASNIFLDKSSYDAVCYFSNNGGQTHTNVGYYYPSSVAFSPVTPIFSDAGGGNFSSKQYYQDPYRPRRVFQAKKSQGLCQFDFATNNFIIKISPDRLQPGFTTCGTSSTGTWNIMNNEVIRGMSFSPQTINSMHILLNGRYPDGNGCSSTPSVIKYIGNNIDDCWYTHNDLYDASSPQWANITPDWANLSTIGNCNNVPTIDTYGILFREIETSPWNKDLVYVLLYIPNNQTVKVMKYDGVTWSNYSAGLPNDEFPYSMIMDHVSNDAIYLSTDKGVYYRDATMGSWLAYKNQLPITHSRQMEINYKENTVRAGVYGRGIWKSPLYCPTTSNLSLPVVPNSAVSVGYYEANNITVSSNVVQVTKPTVFRATNSVLFTPGFLATASPISNTYLLALIHGCNGGGTSSFQSFRNFHTSAAEDELLNDKSFESAKVKVFPNPNKGEFEIFIEDQKDAEVNVYNIMGQLIESSHITSEKKSISLANFASGVYYCKVTFDNTTVVKQIIKE